MRELILNYTERCNGRCTTCHIWKLKKPRMLQIGVIKRLFASKRLADLRNVYLTGGEPFLTNMCIQIADILAKNHPRAMITGATNALRPPEYLTRMLRIRELVPIMPSVSVNGDEALHDRTRGIKGSYRLCLLMMDLLQEHGIPFDIAFLRTPETTEDDIRKVQKLAHFYGVNVGTTLPRTGTRYNTPYDSEAHLNFTCPALKDICVIWPDGRVTACEEDKPGLEVGNLYDEDFDDMEISGARELIEDGMCRPCSMLCFKGRG